MTTAGSERLFDNSTNYDYLSGLRRSVYEPRTYPNYPTDPTEWGVAFGGDKYEEHSLTELSVEYAVSVPSLPYELHHRNADYRKVGIRSALTEGSPLASNRRDNWLAVCGLASMFGVIIGGFISCNQTVKQGVDTAASLQNDYQSMPSHEFEDPGQVGNPLLPSWQLPSFDPDLPLQVEPPLPSPAITGVATELEVPEKQLTCVKRWSLERQVGQLVSVPLDDSGVYDLRTQATKRATMRVMRELHVGGIILTAGTPAQKKSIKNEYSAKNAFEAPLLIGDSQADEWYGLNKPTLKTSADMGAPAVDGGKQLEIARIFGQELKAKTNAPVYLSDTVHEKNPISLFEQVKSMRDEGVRMVLRGELTQDKLAKMVVLNFMARGTHGANPCAVQINH